MIINQATDDVVELNSVESGGEIINEIQQPSSDFVDTIIHIGDSGDSFFQEVVAVSTTLTPPQDVVNNFSYEKMDEEEEEIEKMGNLAPLYVEVSHDFLLSVRIRLSPAQPRLYLVIFTFYRFICHSYQGPLILFVLIYHQRQDFYS